MATFKASLPKGIISKTLNLLDESAGLYQKNWEKFAGALVGVFFIVFFIGLVNFLVGMLSRTACEHSNPIVLLFFCSSLFLPIGQEIIGFLLGFLMVPFTLSLLKPFQELAERKVVSSWTHHLSKNLKNAAISSIFRINANALVWLPFLLFSLFDYAVINEKLLNYMSWNFSRILGASLLPFVILAMALLFLAATVNFLLLFLEPEMVLGRKSIFQAAKSSAELATTRFGETFSYVAVWYAIGVILFLFGTMLSCLSCLLKPMVWVVWIGFIYPVQNISLVMLWRRVKEFKEEEKRVIETPLPPEEYIRKAKSKMVLSWE